MTDIFKYMDAVSFSKQDIIRESSDPDSAEKEYNPFMTNRSMSYHIDSVLYANEMNLRAHLPNIMQFDFMLNTLRKRKRFAKWVKPVKSDDLDLVMGYFGYNRVRAEEALRILTPENIAMIRQSLDRGGVINERKNSRGTRGGNSKNS